MTSPTSALPTSDPQVKTEPGTSEDVDMINGIHAPSAPTASGGSEQDASGGGAAGSAPAPPAGASTATIAPVPLPTRKDRSLREFLDMMEEYAPIIPDAVTDYYLSLAGLQTSDIRLKRLLALAAQKFIADIAADAYQYSRIRQNSSNAGGAPGIGVAGAAAGGAVAPGGPMRPVARPGFGGGGGSGGTAGRTVLTMEDLGSAVGEYGVNTRRPEFYR